MKPKTMEKLQKKQSLPDQAYGLLREAVIHGRLKPGERLGQAQLSSDLGVSDRTVREALARLVADGLVSREPYREFRVVGVTAQEIGEILQMRILLEGWAMELAAAKITQEELAQMRALMPQIEASTSLESVMAFQGSNRDFHWIAINACKRRHLVHMLKRLWDLMLPYALTKDDPERLVVSTQKTDIARLQLSHLQLIETLGSGDGPSARAVLAKHAEEAMEQVRMHVRRLNTHSGRENGRLFLRRLLPIRTSFSEKDNVPAQVGQRSR